MVVSFEHSQGKLILTLREIRRSCNDGTQDVWCKETSFRGGGKNHENSASFFGGIGCVFIERLW